MSSFVVRGQKQPKKGHMRNHSVLWNRPLCPFFAASLENFGSPYYTTGPHPNLLAGTLRGAMACAWHVPHSNGFAHNGHVDFGQWLGPGRSQKSLSIVPCKGTIKRQKKATWETTTKYYKAACTWWNSAGITTIGTFHIRIHTLRGPYRSFLLWAVLGSI
jgi:hypothetical protein